MEVVVMMMIYFCICLKIVKKQCICACKRAQPSGDTQLVLALGSRFGFRKRQDDPTTAPIRAKMAEVGPKVAQDVFKLAPMWPNVSHGAGPEVAFSR